MRRENATSHLWTLAIAIGCAQEAWTKLMDWSIDCRVAFATGRCWPMLAFHDGLLEGGYSFSGSFNLFWSCGGNRVSSISACYRMFCVPVTPSVFIGQQEMGPYSVVEMKYWLLPEKSCGSCVLRRSRAVRSEEAQRKG